jgi:hypothetical protein
MESKYIINVAYNAGERVDGSTSWKHFFKVEATTYEQAQDIYYSLHNAYPDHNVTATYWKVEGTPMR